MPCICSWYVSAASFQAARRAPDPRGGQARRRPTLARCSRSLLRPRASPCRDRRGRWATPARCRASSARSRRTARRRRRRWVVACPRSLSRGRARSRDVRIRSSFSFSVDTFRTQTAENRLVRGSFESRRPDSDEVAAKADVWRKREEPETPPPLPDSGPDAHARSHARRRRRRRTARLSRGRPSLGRSGKPRRASPTKRTSRAAPQALR